MQMALETDAEHRDALYNLAYAQEETGQIKQAINNLKKLIASAPDYADAHFNLARLLVRDNNASAALAYWKNYLQYDQDSHWAGVARRQVLIQERS